MSRDMKSRQIELFDLLSRETDGGDVALKCQQAHRYLDPFPEDVEGSFDSILSYLEQLGQHEKRSVLDVLWRRGLLDARGTVYDQVEYGHRVLLFLIRLSGSSLQDTRVDEDCQRVVREYCGKYSVEDRIRLEDERTLRELYQEDADTAEGQWWRQRLEYSSGDELSDWSTSSSHDREEEEEEEISSLLETNDKDARDDEQLPPNQVVMVEDEARQYMERRTKPVIRDDTWKLSGTESKWKESGRYANVYRPSSLSVWLASKKCTSHLSDALNPRYCVSEAVFVTQMMNCIQGYDHPGFICSLEGEYVMKSGVHLENVSMDALEQVACQALGLANDLKRVEKHVEVLKRDIDPVVDSQSVALSHAHALERQIHICREYCKQAAHGRSLIALLHATTAVRKSSQMMECLCRVMQSGKGENIKENLDEMQMLIESLHLECSSGWTATVMHVVLEILLSMLIPYAHAMETLMRNGTLNSLPKECRALVEDRSTSACPLIIEEPWDDAVSISKMVSRLDDGSSVDDLGSVTCMVLEVFRNYMDTFELGFVEQSDSPRDQPISETTLYWWNEVWMSEINTLDVTLSKNLIGLPNDADTYVVPSPQHTSAFDTFACVNSGIGHQFGSLMAKSSQSMLQSFRKSSKRQSNYSSDYGALGTASIIDTIASRVMEKIEDIFIPSSVLPDSASGNQWPIPPTACITDRLSAMVSAHSVALGKITLRDGIVEQLGAAKSVVLLDDLLWGRLVSGLLESSSSRSGLDSIALSNANTALCDILDNDTVGLRRHISSAWIECCTSNETHTSFATRTTAYVKILRWHVIFRPPLDAMIEKESIEAMNNMRDLVLQLQWVWKTLSSTKKICIKLGGDAVTKHTHASLLSMLTLLRQIMNYVYSSFEHTFSEVIRRIQGTENIAQIEQCIHTGLSHQTSLCPTTPLRSHLETWMDSCLHYGILVSRSILHSSETMPFSTTLSPSTKSFEGGIASAEADVTAAQSALIPLVQQVCTLYIK